MRKMPLERKLKMIRDELWDVYNRDELRRHEFDVMVPISNLLDDLDEIIEKLPSDLKY